MVYMIGWFKYFIDWKFWSDEEVCEIFDFVCKVKCYCWEYQGYMQGNILVMVFQKILIRICVLFEVGMMEFGGYVINFEWEKSNFMFSKIFFEMQYLSCNVVFIMVCFKLNEDFWEMEMVVMVFVINGCCNFYYLCQVFVDMFIIVDDCVVDGNDDIVGICLMFIGVYNNVVNLFVLICSVFGVYLMFVCLFGDEELIDQELRNKLCDQGFLMEMFDVCVVVVDVDYVYIDMWFDMEFFNDLSFVEEKQCCVDLMLLYQVNFEFFSNSKVKVMYDMFIYLGYEMFEEIVDDLRFIIFDQVENCFDVQKVIMLYLLYELK